MCGSRARGFIARTQESYTRTVRMLTEYYHKTPDAVSEEELREYFLHRENVSMWSPKTMRICYCGIRFFFLHFTPKYSDRAI